MKPRVVAATNKRRRTATTPRPSKKKHRRSPKGAWIGKVEIVGNIVEFDTTALWEALR
jgi:hypothetical protein